MPIFDRYWCEDTILGLPSSKLKMMRTAILGLLPSFTRSYMVVNIINQAITPTWYLYKRVYHLLVLSGKNMFLNESYLLQTLLPRHRIRSCCNTFVTSSRWKLRRSYFRRKICHKRFRRDHHRRRYLCHGHLHLIRCLRIPSRLKFYQYQRQHRRHNQVRRLTNPTSWNLKTTFFSCWVMHLSQRLLSAVPYTKILPVDGKTFSRKAYQRRSEII